MYYMWELSKAGGVKMDLADPKSMSAAMKQLKIKNPQLALNEIAASQENVLEQGTSSYLTGLNASVGPIQALNTVAGQLAETFGALKAVVDSIASTRSGGALGGLMGDVASGAGMMLATQMMGGGGGGGGGRRGGGGSPQNNPTGSAYFAKGRNPAKPGLKGPSAIPKGLKVAGAAGAVVSAVSTVSNIAAGAPMGRSIGEGIGSIAGGILGGIAGSFAAMPGVGTFLGGMAGSTLGAQLGGAIGGLFDNTGGQGKGGKSPDPSSMNADTVDRKAAHSAAQWHRPAAGNISSGWGKRKAEFAGMSTYHYGVDVANKAGTRIDAAASGKVIETRRSNSGFGNYVRIYHRQFNMTSGYAHMSSFSVRKGDRVKGGQKIGSMGMTGTANGNHLHFNLAKGKSADYINPETIRGLGLGAGGKSGPSLTEGGGGNGAKNSVLASSSPSKFGIPSSGTFGGGSSSLGTGNYGVEEVDYLGSSGTGAGIYGNSTTSLLYAAGSKLVNDDKQTEGKGGESTVTPLSSMGSGSSFEYNSEKSPASKSSSNGEAPTVNIHLTIAKATDAEARKFAQKVKSILENDSNISAIGKK